VNKTTWDKLSDAQPCYARRPSARKRRPNLVRECERYKTQADAGIQTIKFDGAVAEAYRAKAYQAGWEGVIKQSPEHGPKIKEFFAKK
jgi:hypothetical protein